MRLREKTQGPKWSLLWAGCNLRSIEIARETCRILSQNCLNKVGWWTRALIPSYVSWYFTADYFILYVQYSGINFYAFLSNIPYLYHAKRSQCRCLYRVFEKVVVKLQQRRITTLSLGSNNINFRVIIRHFQLRSRNSLRNCIAWGNLSKRRSTNQWNVRRQSVQNQRAKNTEISKSNFRGCERSESVHTLNLKGRIFWRVFGNPDTSS